MQLLKSMILIHLLCSALLYGAIVRHPALVGTSMDVGQIVQGQQVEDVPTQPSCLVTTKYRNYQDHDGPWFRPFSEGGSCHLLAL